MVILKLHKSYCLSEYKQNLQKKNKFIFYSSDNENEALWAESPG